MKKCIGCGATLPDSASFCHDCATSQIEKLSPPPPIPAKKKKLRTLLAGALAAAVILSLALILPKLGEPSSSGPVLWPTPSPEARVYDNGGADMLYTHEGRSYRLAVSFTQRDSIAHCAEGESEKEAVIGANQNYQTFTNLFVLSEDKNSFADAEFSKLVKAVRINAAPVDDAEPIELSNPAPDSNNPDAYRSSAFYFSSANARNDITWEIEMLSGDIIRLHHAFIVSIAEKLSYSYHDYPMNTIGELQALIDHICAETDEDTEVDILLPPVTYEGGLHISGRSINFSGSFNGENGTLRTAFTGTVTVDGFGPTAGCFRNTVFEVPGGIGLLARQSVQLYNCVFRGCEIGACAEGEGWIISSGSVYENNGVGIDINNFSNARLTNMDYFSNRFTGNGIAFRLSNCSYSSPFNFDACYFSGNDQNIVAMCGNFLDLSGADLE